jgi:hypothetical protein
MSRGSLSIFWCLQYISSRFYSFHCRVFHLLG